MNGYMPGTGTVFAWAEICCGRYADKYFRLSCYDRFQCGPTAELIEILRWLTTIKFRDTRGYA
jgi:hypothetical protein